MEIRESCLRQAQRGRQAADGKSALPRSRSWLALVIGLGWIGVLPAAPAPLSFTVTTTRDTGPGSLREALTWANRSSAPKTIQFDIPKSDPGFAPRPGTWTITFRDTPPAITSGNLLLDGFSQPARQGNLNPHGPEIVLSGDRHSVECAFLLVNVSNVTVRGFAICEFIYGIQVYGPGSHHNRILGNHVGLSADGRTAAGNYNGIELLSGAHDNVIGGADPAERNLVSGNEHIGIRVSDAHRNVILGNFIGLDRTGTRAVPNHDGICVEGRARGNVIGGAKPGERNIASGNVAYGVDLFGVGVQENLVLGNFLGTDVTGTQAVPNTYGVLFDDRASRNVVGGTNAGEWNLISGNTAFGAYFYNNGTCSNAVVGNRIGTHVTGTLALPNETGVHIDGGTRYNLVDQNLISGNLVAGVTIFALHTDHNLITRNRIGTDLSGQRPLGNGEDGVRIAFGPKNNVIGGSPAAGNIIAHNGRRGVNLESDRASSNHVSGNSIYGNGRDGR